MSKENLTSPRAPFFSAHSPMMTRTRKPARNALVSAPCLGALALTLTLVACGNEDQPPEDTGGTAGTSTTGGTAGKPGTTGGTGAMGGSSATGGTGANGGTGTGGTGGSTAGTGGSATAGSGGTGATGGTGTGGTGGTLPVAGTGGSSAGTGGTVGQAGAGASGAGGMFGGAGTFGAGGRGMGGRAAGGSSGTGPAGGMPGASGSSAGGSGDGTCTKGTQGKEVAVIGESFIAATHGITKEIESKATAAGALPSGQHYVDNSVSGTTLANNQIPSQYDKAVQSSGTIKYVLMDGGGNDCLINMNGDAALTAATSLFKNMADHSTQKIVYFFYPDPIGSNFASLKTCLDALRPKMKALCDGLTAPKCYWMDLRDTWNGHPEYTSDGIHPTDAGSKATGDAIWNEMVKDCVAQ